MPMGMATSRAKKRAPSGEFDGRRQPFGNEIGHRLPLDIGVPEIAANCTLEEQPQLYGEWFVQVKLVAQLLHFSGAHGPVLAQHDIYRVARGEAHKEKDHNGHAKHDGDDHQDTFHNFECAHSLLF